ncbi:uncharacterized protein LOC127080083 [Lathyrus oleraceus]|uniref:uncharacterized protein LOC127080083 n=1 Tax=Pisum sativum TaxID=3888 RepID=UPI0021D132E3|nr:uncharacterized protein LOC127080083 [Pisum sativum]
MKACGETLTDKMIVENVMCTLTSHFDHVIVTIQESNNLETMKLEDLVGSLEAHEMRFVERKCVQDSIQALQARTWKKHGKTRERDKVKEEGANLVRQDSNDSEDMVVMVAVAGDHVDSKIWFLDTGCLNHMTGRKVWLADFDESRKRKVKLADNSSL